MQPSVGRVVHYYEPTHLRPPRGPMAAIIEHVCPCGCNTVDLTVFKGGPRYEADVPFAEEPTQGRWSWPSRQ